MADTNRFSGLMGGLNQGEGEAAEEPKEKAQQKTSQSTDKPKAKSKKPLPKSKDPNYSQIGLCLPNEMHRKMKIGAAITGLEMSEIAAQGIQLWLEKNLPDN